MANNSSQCAAPGLASAKVGDDVEDTDEEEIKPIADVPSWNVFQYRSVYVHASNFIRFCAIF